MVVWSSNPDFKIEVGATELSTETLSVEVLRIENAVAVAKVLLNNKKSVNYIDNIDLFGNLKVSFRRGSAAWTEAFDGIVEEVGPKMDRNTGYLVGAVAYGQGRALRNTFCNATYGTESQNPTIDTPGEIWTDIVDNYVEKSFGGAATGYTLTLAYNNETLPTVPFMFNPYLCNFDLINQVIQLIQAYRDGSSGHHWIVGTDGQLRIKRIGTDIAGWSSWWNTDQAGSTLVEGEDFISYGFSKRAKAKQFANRIILTTDLRKPGYDYWTELATAALNTAWDKTNATLTGDNTEAIVGTYSLLAEPTVDDGSNALFWYPSAKTAAWDFTKVGSKDHPPTIEFQYRVSRDLGGTGGPYLSLYTSAGNYYWLNLYGITGSTVDTWVHCEIPIGTYAERTAKNDFYDWLEQGAPDWNDINWIQILWASNHLDTDLRLDDLHFNGKIIREAYNSTSITAYDEVQKIMRMNIAVEDSMKQADDSGMAARLAYAELLTAQKIANTGTLETPGIVDILPGQIIHGHAEQKSDGTFRIDSDLRIKQTSQMFRENGFRTTLQVTDDLINSFAKTPVELASVVYQMAFIDPEAKSLRATGVDPLVTRLSIDYPS